jgi:hypothetical protein
MHLGLHAGLDAVAGLLGLEGIFTGWDLAWLRHGEGATPPCQGFRAFDLAFLGVIALAIVMALRMRHANARRRIDLARRMVEKGMEPPEHLLGRDHAGDLRRGFILISTGIGIVLASWFGRGEPSAAGLVPGFIGIGYLVSHRFARREGPPDPKGGGFT